MLNQVDPRTLDKQAFDVIIIGSGFGSSFYLHRLLEKGSSSRVLVLEWGTHNPQAWQVEQQRNSPIPHRSTYRSDSDKIWNFTIGLGGGMNCWFAQSPRLHPSDFALRSRYGVGQDWPISYAELEPYYVAAEEIMSVSGDPASAAIFPRSAPYPQPPHRMTTPDRIMAKAQPGQHLAMPTARARVATDKRAACCASFRCQYCPANAKFTFDNGLIDLYAHPAVTLATGAKVQRLEGDGGAVRAAVVEVGGREVRVRGDRFVLGANAIHGPAILLRSSMDGGLTGRGLHESHGCHVEALLDGVDGMDGSTITTGLNWGLYDGEHRRDAGGALVYFENRWTHGLRAERGRWRQTVPIMVVVEELPDDRNRVTVDGAGEPVVTFTGASGYAERGQARALKELPALLAPLPVEEVAFRHQRPTESHLQGTLRMGRDPARSVIDGDMIHHRWRNLTVVGTAAFPTCAAANPSLTAAALSLRAADRA